MCGRDREAAASDQYDPRRTYRFVPTLWRRVLENLGIAAAASVMLTMFLCTPGGSLTMPLGAALAVSASLAIAVFLLMSLPYLSPATAREVEVSPDGIVIVRRDGSRDILPWSKIRGYVHEGERYVFMMKNGESVVLLTFGFTAEEKAMLRTAIRTPLEPGSIKWRARRETGPPLSARSPLLVILACVILGGALVYTGHRQWAALFLVGGAAYLVAMWWLGRRR